MADQPGGRRAFRFRLWRTCAVLTAIVLGVTAPPATASTSVGSTGGTATVSRELSAELADGGTATFTVYLRERATLSGAAKLTDPDARAAEVFKQLTGTAVRTQRGLRAALDARKASYTPFWIANAVVLTGNQALLDEMAARPEVDRVDPAREYELVLPERVENGTDAGTDAAEWGLTNIEAPRVWTGFGVRGEGVVIASIDSGVQYDHPALVGKYRGNLGGGSFDHNYNWFDPADVCAAPAPCDNNNHGTHTMGTMVGDDGAANQIGVAPGANWISAKGCETNSCSTTSLLAAGQWILAPTDLNGQNPRPDLRPDIVNNSWGGDADDLWYQQTVAAWRAAGIFPTFSAGNDGPGCGTAGSPGDYPDSYAVGSYDVNNNISSFSGRGASQVDGGIKPNISAPGSNVRSSIPGDGYDSFSGTSMAAPHVSGTVALVWSAAPSLRGDIAATSTLLGDTATDVNALGCGGTVDDNNTFGEGRLNAYQAVNAAPRGPLGRVTGTVTDSADGDPVAAALVATGTVSTTTGADGQYALTLPAGEHVLTASAYGYATRTGTVIVTEGRAVTKNFALVASPTVRISGKVTDGSGHGWPLYARIEIAGRPGAPVFTDPATGRYSFTVPGDANYRLTSTVRYPGYQTVTTDVTVGAEPKTVNVAVPVDPGCTAPGYSTRISNPLLTENFDGTTAPAGWSVVNRTSKGGWQFDDPGQRGNLTGGTGGFAIVDSDKLGSGNTQDTDLISPSVDLSGATAPTLRFNSDWRAVGISDTADVDVSTNGGTSWTSVWQQTASRRGPRVEEIPLTAAAGAADVRFRFRFKGTFAWWWEIDDVRLVNRVCTPAPGGLVVGSTTDSNTGTPLNNVKVTSRDDPLDSGRSAATPDDPNIPDGFYWLFSSLTGPHPFTATRPPYRPATKTVPVAADDTVRASFGLGAGRLAVSPTTIESHQPYGSTRSTTVTVKNTGNAPARVEVLERGGQFEMLSREGAALAEYKMKGISKARTGVAYGAEGGTTGATPQVDPAWTKVANAPAAVFDNSAANLDGKVYSFGGGSGTGTEKKAWVHDPTVNVWTALPDMPTARSKPSVAAVNGKLYVIGGWGSDSTTLSSVDMFDPVSGLWSTLAGATNPAPRAAAGTAVSGGKVYLVGGCADSACTDSDDLVVFDPSSGSFRTGADYPLAVSWMSCGGIGDTVYCAGGVGVDEFKDAFGYDPDTDAWTPLPDLPIDLWGSQYASANGLLVLAGGVTGGSTTVTNRTLAYDPSAGGWLNLPNAQFTRYRGAGACGAYKIGGSAASFVGSVDTEHLGGLAACAEEGDVSWLSTDPTMFTLAPGATATVKVNLAGTAAAGVAQPGTYTADLGFASDSPYPVSAVKVGMTVSPPVNWGKLQGTVVGRTCAGDLVPLRATVRVNPVASPGVGYTLSSGSQGRYTYWVPKGRYDVIVAKDGWVPQVKRQVVQAGFVSTLDFTLDPVNGCTLGGI